MVLFFSALPCDLVDIIIVCAFCSPGTEPISKGKSKEETTEFMFEEGKLVIKDIGERSLLDKGRPFSCRVIFHMFF